MPSRKSSMIIALLMLFAFANASAALTKYTAANVKGGYSFLLNKWPGPTSPDGAVLGRLNFDGASAVSGFFTVIDSGSLTVYSILAGSTYSVNPNGSGSIALNLSGGGTDRFSFVLNSVTGSIAKSLQLLVINNSDNNSNVIAGTANSINLSGPATAANLKGAYSLLLNWWTPETQQALVGTIVFDGKSKVTLSFTEQQGPGSVTTGTGKGTYSVKSNGSGSIGLQLSNGTTMQLDLVLNSVSGAVAKGLQLLDVTNPSGPSVDTGTAVYQ
jgi:hypothetical protein